MDEYCELTRYELKTFNLLTAIGQKEHEEHLNTDPRGTFMKLVYDAKEEYEVP